MNGKIGLILILSVLTVTFSGCVEEGPAMPSQPIAPMVEAALQHRLQSQHQLQQQLLYQLRPNLLKYLSQNK